MFFLVNNSNLIKTFSIPISSTPEDFIPATKHVHPTSPSTPHHVKWTSLIDRKCCPPPHLRMAPISMLSATPELFSFNQLTSISFPITITHKRTPSFDTRAPAPAKDAAIGNISIISSLITRNKSSWLGWSDQGPSELWSSSQTDAEPVNHLGYRF